MAAADPGLDFFEKKIRPVLVEHCYSCHSSAAQKQKGGLTLDSRESVRKGGDSGPAIVPGKPSESLLLKAVRHTDDELRMPPKGKLPDAVLVDLEKWIALGAPDPRESVRLTATAPKPTDVKDSSFWAFQPLRRQPAPNGTNTSWPRGTIDRFLLAQLEAKGLQPVADADRATLLRRAYFDLLGLPPTPEQLSAFLADRSPDAFARVLDQLLASQHFGERWGRHWLDVARFAESSGGGRSLLFKEAWRYRDYVIEAFNADKPYDQFVAEQVAGDLLPWSTPEQRRQQLVATAFLVLGPTNYERQDKDILEMDVIDEQLDTLGKAFLGMTIGCARCHDHKFDPIPTKEYYALAGILRSTRTLIHDNVSRWVEQPLPLSGEQGTAVAKHEAAVAVLQEKIKLARDAEKKAGRVSSVAGTKGPLAASALPGIVVDDTQARQVGPWRHSRYSNNYIGEGYLYDDRSVQAEKTLTFVPEFARGGRYEVRLAYVSHANRAEKVPVRIFHAEGEHTVYVNQRETPPIDGRFVSLGHYRFEPGSQWFVMLSSAGAKGHAVADAVQFLPEESATGKERAPQPPAAKDRTSPTPDSTQLEAELRRLQQEGPARPLAMCVVDADKVEDFFVCIRGNVHNRGEKAPRGFLRAATVGQPPVISAGESGRRELAVWLTRPENPLTARVMVNRIWHWLFGAGLVRTVDNFGSTGELPSHPELLDYLALRFLQEGWSVKTLIREIMLSRTYQLSCEVSPGNSHARLALTVDPENRLLRRMNRRRLDAEAIRDAILTVSGQLDRTPGGPTIRKGTAKEYGYTFEDTRRSVYTPVFRNRLLELFEVFDFADPNLLMGRRNVSTVAPQALYLLNSPFVMEQARHAARAALVVPGLDATGRVGHAYRLALGRAPTERERQLALNAVGAGEEAPLEQRLAAWERLYQALFACVDFRYVN